MNKKNKQSLKQPFASNCRTFVRRYALLSLFLVMGGVCVQTATAGENDDEMINQYVKAQGNTAIIQFDASNIKQFWDDKSVLSKDGLIHVFGTKNGEKWQSVPLNIQLANVDESLECKISIIADSQDVSFSVLNSGKKVLSQSSKGDDFLQYHLASSSFAMEKAAGFSFKLQFESGISEQMSFKRIVLSFSKNKNGSFLSSPESILITKDAVSPSKDTQLGDNGFVVTGKNSRLLFDKNIILPRNELKSSVTIQNSGETPAKVYVGYSIQAKDGSKLGARNYPYNKNCNVLTVVSSEAESKTIVVNGVSEWAKKCYLALDAKEDLSDIPNKNFVDGHIASVKQLDNGQMEITLDAPLKEALKTGEKIRVHGIANTYLYTDIKVLQPGEKETFTSSLKKTDDKSVFDSESFPVGVYYVKPLILSNSVDATKDNSITISDYSVSF